MENLITDNYTFIFVLIRISVIFAFGIFFGDKRIPKLSKTAFAFLIAVIVYPTIDTTLNTTALTDYDFMILLVSESLIGLIIGFMSSIILSIMQTAGSIIDIQGGFGMAQVYDPTTQSQTAIVSQFLISIGLLFFVLNGLHITFLELVMESFNIIPIGSINNIDGFTSIFENVIKALLGSITIGITIAMPVISIVFMVDIILGVMTRAMPQINIFSVGYIIKILLTLILIYVYTSIMSLLVSNASTYIFKAIERMG